MPLTLNQCCSIVQIRILVTTNFFWCAMMYTLNKCLPSNIWECMLMRHSVLKSISIGKKVKQWTNILRCYSATLLHDDLSVNWLNVTRKCTCVNELYKLLTGHGPRRLTEQFKSRNITKNIRSKNENNLKLPLVRLKISENDFVYCPVKQ